MPREDEDRTGNGPSGSSCNSAHERLDPVVTRKSAIERSSHHNHQVNREEYAQSSEYCSGQPVGQIANKSDCNDDRSRSDHRNRNRIQKLTLVEPLVRLDYTTVEERDNCKPTANYK